ncbi:MAG: PEP-CTERM sorting domain-containing protein [Pseudomonadota bacterium]
MKTKILMETMALAVLGLGSAHASTISLQTATVTATYNGAASGMLGLDHLFAAEAGSNITKLDPADSGDIELLTADYLFGVDFSSGGALNVLANGPIPSGSYVMRFDFGTTLAHAINGFTLTDMGGNGGAPLLTIINDHTLQLDLSNITWNGDFSMLSAQIATVPEPGSTTLVFAGLAGLALTRRARTARR